MSAKAKLKIVIFYGSVRAGRMASRVGQYVQAQVTQQGMEPVILDPKEIPFDMLKIPLHFQPKPEDAPAFLQEIDAKIRSADGFIVLCPEYNCSPPPALLNMLDHFSPGAYIHRPVGVITYSIGTTGGLRAGVLLRPQLSDMGMAVIPSWVYISKVQDAFSEDGNCLEDHTGAGICKLIKDLEWYAEALKNHKIVKAPVPGMFP